MKKIIITCCIVMLGFTLTSCANENDSDFAKHEEITNMSQLPFDLTKLESESKSYQTNPVFLSTTVEPLVQEFEVNLNNLTVNSYENDYYLNYIDERGARIYSSSNDNTQLKSTQIEGGVQVLYTMSNSKSPNEFSLELMLSDDSELVVDENNQYYVIDSNGDVEIYIGQPWAVDAIGDFVDTYYVVEENIIKQVIDYEGSNYPVQADPLFCTNTIDNGATTWDSDYSSQGGSLKVVPTTCARIYLIGMYINPFQTLTVSLALNVPLIADMYSETVNDYSYKTHITYNEDGILDQFVCHAYNPFTTVKSSWNLEPWRPNVSLWDTYTSLCNP